jgi:hypothetical protein
MNGRPGARAERRVIRILEAAGYVCTKAGSSLGLFDVIANRPVGCALYSGEGERVSVSGRARIDQAVHDLYQKSVSDTASDETLLLQTAQFKTSTDWSPDGRFLLYDSVDPIRNIDRRHSRCCRKAFRSEVRINGRLPTVVILTW